MPPILSQEEYYKRFGEYYSNLADFIEQRDGDPALKPPEPVDIPDETLPSREDLGYAFFAKDSYRDIDERSDFNNYQYLPQDSTERVGVYKSDEDNEVVYAIQGTELQDQPIQDFFRNAGIAIGGPTTELFDPTYYSYKKHIENTNKKYSTHRPVIVGHSQGGTYAGLLGTTNPNYKTITFNAGSGFIPSSMDFKCLISGCDNIKQYRIVGDWASANQITNSFQLRPKIGDPELERQAEQADRIYIPQDYLLTHGINNFIGRNESNLKTDYGAYGRKIARRVGDFAGLFALPAIGKKVGEKLVRTSMVSESNPLFRQASVRAGLTGFGPPTQQTIQAREAAQAIGRSVATTAQGAVVEGAIAEGAVAEMSILERIKDLQMTSNRLGTQIEGQLTSGLSESSLGTGSGFGNIRPPQLSSLLSETPTLSLLQGNVEDAIARSIARSSPTAGLASEIAMGDLAAALGTGGILSGITSLSELRSRLALPTMGAIGTVLKGNTVTKGVLGFGIGDVLGGLAYDNLIKPSEEEILTF